MTGHRDLDAFLETDRLEAAHGGAPVKGWWYTLSSIFLTIGLALQLGGAPALAGVSDEKMPPKTYKEYVKGVQTKIDGVHQKRTVAILDRGRAQKSAAYIVSALAETMRKQGKDLHNFRLVFSLKKDASGMTGLAYRVDNEEGSGLIDLGVVLPMNPATTGRTKSTSYADLPEKQPLREDFAVSTEESALFSAYHEAFGHCTEGPDLLRPGIPYTDYIRHLREVRSDIAATICLARDEGHTGTGRNIAMIRDLGAWYGMLEVKSSHRMGGSSGTCIYNIGGTSMQVCEELDKTLADPEKAAAFRAMSDDEVVALTNHYFNKVKPSEKEFAEQNAALEAAVAQEINPAAHAQLRANPHMAVKSLSFLRRFDAASKALLGKPLDNDGKETAAPPPHMVIWAKKRPVPPAPAPAPAL